jgi:hypothetical protein
MKGVNNMNDNVKELYIDKEFENKINRGELSVKDIKDFMKEKKISSLIFTDKVTTIHQNPVVLSDFYCFGEGSIIDKKGNEYWEMDLEDFLYIRKYNESLIGIKGLLKEQFLIEEFKPESQELLKEKFEVISYNEKSEIIKYTFYVQEEAKLYICQYLYDSALKDEQGIKHDIILTDIKGLYSLFK